MINMTDMVFLIVYLTNPLAEGWGGTILVTQSTTEMGGSDSNDALLLQKPSLNATSGSMMASNGLKLSL